MRVQYKDYLVVEAMKKKNRDYSFNYNNQQITTKKMVVISSDLYILV